MPALESIGLLAAYVLTAALVVTLVFTARGGVRYFLTVSPVATAAVVAIPAAGWALQSREALLFGHIVGVLLFAGGHGVAVALAFMLPKAEDGTRASAYMRLSYVSVYPMQAGLGLLIGSGVALGFLGGWWGQLWIWLALDVLLATMALMFAMTLDAYTVVRDRLTEEGPAAWDAEARALVTLRRAVILLVTGSGSLLAILFLMVFKPF
jgi:uncharacterized membrane protein